MDYSKCERLQNEDTVENPIVGLRGQVTLKHKGANKSIGS